MGEKSTRLAGGLDEVLYSFGAQQAIVELKLAISTNFPAASGRRHN